MSQSIPAFALICQFMVSQRHQANQVHPKNWYPIPLVFCRPWGKLPENVPCHPKLADFANCMKKKGRGMSIFINTLDGDYHERAEDAKAASNLIPTLMTRTVKGMGEAWRWRGVLWSRAWASAGLVVASGRISEGRHGSSAMKRYGCLRVTRLLRDEEIWSGDDTAHTSGRGITLLVHDEEFLAIFRKGDNSILTR
ncbi:transducin beta-like protein 2-like [Hibiscus syriacus]|uniref:Transducin beta-like protein 2-like n=1 Tax=Hibiscus syriacus TaxID=106335 RepID=A0A6A2YA54_HIBSY|nr:transducin beta-like protein 2-like [Hibiscus syriacus]